MLDITREGGEQYKKYECKICIGAHAVESNYSIGRDNGTPFTGFNCAYGKPGHINQSIAKRF